MRVRPPRSPLRSTHAVSALVHASERGCGARRCHSVLWRLEVGRTAPLALRCRPRERPARPGVHPFGGIAPAAQLAILFWSEVSREAPGAAPASALRGST